MPDLDSYHAKKQFFDSVLTVYGRNVVHEVLLDTSLQCHCLHLAHSNRDSGVVEKIKALAGKRGISIQHHSREELARISKNGKQDQGVAADIICPAFNTWDSFLENLEPSAPVRLLALDGINNPQNLGMIIRSAAAGEIDGILWARRGNAALGPLVIKASAGALYRAPIIVCKSLSEALRSARDNLIKVCTLEANAARSLFEPEPGKRCLYVLGNESEGVSAQVKSLADEALSIPMNNNIESLNVAVAASLIAFASGLRSPPT